MTSQNTGSKEEKMTTENSVYDFRVEGHSKIFKTIDEAIEYCDDNYPLEYSSIVQFKDGKKNPDYWGDDIEDGQGRCSNDACKATKNLFMLETGEIVCCGDCEENPDSLCYEGKEEEKLRPWEKIKEKIKDNYETALAFAMGKSSGMEYYATSGVCCDAPVEDFWKSLDRDYFRKEWRVKIFMDIYDDYIIFNGEPYSKDDFEIDYERLVDEKGNKIILLGTGEYISSSKKKTKIKLVVKK